MAATTPQTMILATGAPGSGKSTLALELARALGWPIVDGDDIANNLVTAALGGVGGDPFDLTHPLYDAVLSPSKYRALAAQVGRLVRGGHSTVVALSDAARLRGALGVLDVVEVHVHIDLDWEQRRVRMAKRAKNGFDTAMLAMGPVARWEAIPNGAYVVAGGAATDALVAQVCTEFDLVQRVDDGVGRVVIIAGTPGAGKSTLAQALGDQASMAVLDGEDLASTLVAEVLNEVVGNPTAIDSEFYLRFLSGGKAATLADEAAWMARAQVDSVVAVADGQRMVELLAARGAAALCLFLDTPSDVRAARIRARGKAVDGALAGGYDDDRWSRVPEGAVVLDGSESAGLVLERALGAIATAG